VICFDLLTGQKLWDVVPLRQDPVRKEQKNSYATPTPATDGRRVYAVFGDGSVVALSLEGEVHWTNREVQHYSRHGLGASPILFEGLLIMPYDGSNRVKEPGKWPENSAEERLGWQTPWDQAQIVALDCESGQRVWTARRGMSRVAHTTPFVLTWQGEPQLISTAGDVIQGFNLRTGALLWTVHSQGEGVVPSPVFGDALVFTSSGFEATTLRTVRPGGQGDVTATHVVWEQREGAPKQPSLLYLDPYLFTVTDNGIAHCYDGATGQVLGQRRIGGNFSASPVAADGKLYLLSEEGVTTVVAANPQLTILATNPLDEHCQASMAIAQERLLIRTAGRLYCIGGGA
jgi:outer membrane protein assembly factor BamB